MPYASQLRSNDLPMIHRPSIHLGPVRPGSIRLGSIRLGSICLGSICLGSIGGGRLFLLTLCLALLAGHAQAQDLGVIAGRVVDAGTGKAMVGANIQIQDRKRGTTTDENGRFSVDRLPAGPCRVRVSLIGYETIVVGAEITAAGAADLGTLKLSQDSIRLSEVVVTPGSYSIMGDGLVRAQSLGRQELENMSFAEDITRAVTRLPGVASTDFSSKFTVRGGEADEVLMVLDGMELYEPFHQRDFVGGLSSIIDIGSIDGIDLLTGGFTAEYGDRQSGVFNMRTRRPTERRTRVGLSVMNASLYSEGPMAHGGSYLVTARRGVLDKIRLMSVVDDETTHFFHDAMGKVEMPLGDGRLSAHVLLSGDKAEVRDVEPGVAHDIHDTSFDNLYGWLKYDATHSANLVSRTMLFGGRIGQDRNGDAAKNEPTDKVTFLLTDNRTYTFFGGQQDWVWDKTPRLSFKAGYSLKQVDAEYDYQFSLDDTRVDHDSTIVTYQEAFATDVSPSGQQTGVYLSARFRPLTDLYLESGLRHDRASWSDDAVWSPRLSAALSVGPRTTLRAAWGRYYQSQFINDLDVHHANTDFDPAELSTHYVAGLEHNFLSGIHLRVDGYYKAITNLSDAYQNLRDPWEVFPEARNDVALLEYEDARALGLEVFLKYDQGDKVSWWLSYARARAEETIADLTYDGLLVEQTGTLRRINNQDHTIYADVNYRPNMRWHVNLSWQYYTGWPLTKYTYVTNVPYSDPVADNLHMAAAHSTFRGDDYPAYHRMDVRVNRSFELDRGTLRAYLHIINLYDRENLRKFDVDSRNDDDEFEPDGQGGFVYFRDDTAWFGRLPVVGLSWEF